MIKTIYIFLSSLTIFTALTSFASPSPEPLTPTKVLEKVLSQSPELATLQAGLNAEKMAIETKGTLANPRFGLMQESNLTSDQQAMGDMWSWSFTQEIMFPTKYSTMTTMQSLRADAIAQEVLDKKLEIRQRALSQFFNFYFAKKISDLLVAQRETLREIARIVESRRATGAAPQQDEIKAHLEQTKIENDLLMQSQEASSLCISLYAMLDNSTLDAKGDGATDCVINEKEFALPKITASLDSLHSLAQQNSKMISATKAWTLEAQKSKVFAEQSYLPDFMFSFRKPFGNNSPTNAYAVSLEFSIPLWFMSKQKHEVALASAKTIEADKKLEFTRRQIDSETKDLSNQLQTLEKLMKIYETALIPQSMSSLNSSRTAYSAGRVGFQELLDAERSLYGVRIDYYKTYSRFIETLTKLEKSVGASISDLPFSGIQ